MGAAAARSRWLVRPRISDTRKSGPRVLLVLRARMTNTGLTSAAVLLDDGGHFLDLAPDDRERAQKVTFGYMCSRGAVPVRSSL